MKDMLVNTPSRLVIALLAGMVLLPACSLDSPTAALPQPMVTSAPTGFVEPAPLPDSIAQIELYLETGSIAASFQSEIIAAASAGENVPSWEMMPEHIQLILRGYPLSDHLMQPQIFIYPLETLEIVNADAAQNAVALQSLLQTPQEIETMPFLPLINARQMIHTHVQFLDFQSGQGVRYLTWFSQGIVPVNNHELIYTYQGISSDGKYYVAAILPVNHPSLPADGTISGDEASDFAANYPTYLMNLVTALNPLAGNTFTPDLAQLDAMISSLEIK